MRYLLSSRKYGVLLNFGNMALDILGKVRHFNVYSVFLTVTCAEFYWTKVIQVCTRSINENLTDDQVNAMDWLTKVRYLQQNPVLVVRQIDYIFQKLMGFVILCKMHPIGQVLNYYEQDEFQFRGPEDLHVLFHVKDAPKIY